MAARTYQDCREPRKREVRAAGIQEEEERDSARSRDHCVQVLLNEARECLRQQASCDVLIDDGGERLMILFVLLDEERGDLPGMLQAFHSPKDQLG
jgi:hypothetical protein